VTTNKRDCVFVRYEMNPKKQFTLLKWRLTRDTVFSVRYEL